eukprot:TRINITY_DN37897_c0_g1_i1.p1 TRINITY_DN37897_c0_g1~~TRINITY_DN37897_c0_g1_i1.p1  ORF type:complete len:474 (+),score=89.04 TRINITY_DN37897_c0_g1_i1:26-1447(+)
MLRDIKGEKLSSEEFDRCSEAFNTFVVENGFGKIDNLWKLRNVLQALGQCPTDEEMTTLLRNGTMEFDDFIDVIEKEKAKFSIPPPPDSDTIQAFIAMGGGGADGASGEVSADLLRRMVKNFDLRLDIDKLIEEVDTDGSGAITYEEFAHMFTATDDSVPQNRPPAKTVFKPVTKSSTRLRKIRDRKAHSMYFSMSDYHKRPQGETDSDLSMCEKETIKKCLQSVPLPEKAAVIASGAKKTSEQRPMTRNELLAVKLRRTERVIKRTGCVGGELQAVQICNRLPAIYVKQKRAAELAKQKKKEQQEREATSEPKGIHPYRRREHVDIDTVLETLSIKPTMMRTWDAGQPKAQRYHEKKEGLTHSLQSAVRSIQHGNLLALSVDQSKRPQSQATTQQADGIQAIRQSLVPNRARTSYARRDLKLLLDKSAKAKAMPDYYNNQLIRHLCSSSSIPQPFASTLPPPLSKVGHSLQF